MWMTQQTADIRGTFREFHSHSFCEIPIGQPVNGPMQIYAATDISIRWAADAWYFVHNAAALLAFTAFAIACIAKNIVGIKSVDCAVRDQPSENKSGCII